jgi:DNA repair exonuclease SbcCD nuclease subunit
MKLCILSDLHVHSWSTLSKIDSNGFNNRLLHTISVLDSVLEYCKTNGVTNILFAGDLLHVKKIDIEVYDLLFRALERIQSSGVKFIATVGNHDQGSRLFECHSIRPLSKVLTLLDNFDSIALEDGTIVAGCGYRPNKNDVLGLYRLAGAAKKPNIVLLHQGILGALASAFFLSPDNADTMAFSDFKEIFEQADLAICGHFHIPQVVGPDGSVFEEKTSAMKRVLVPGSPMHHNFGDVGQRGFWVYDNQTHMLTMKPLSLPQFHKIDKIDPDLVRGNFICLKVPENIGKDELEKLTSRLSESMGYTIEYVPLPEKDRPTRTEIKPSMDYSELITKYVTHKAYEKLDSKRLFDLGMEFVRKAS